MARVLLIDDSPDIVALLRVVLESRMGHEVSVASSGPDGLDRAFSQRPDLALVDVMMPGMTGYEVVKQLRADDRTRAMGIIMLSARGQAVDRKAALTAGADDHIAKPVDIHDLEQRIAALLARRQAASAAHPLTFAVLSLKGGTGATTIAVNAACILQPMGETVLVDLSPSSGHAASALGLRPTTHWGNYLQDPRVPLESLLISHASGLRLLAAPPLPYEAGWFDADRAKLLFMELRALVRFIVIDMPPVLDQAARAILEASEAILLVTGDDPFALQTTLTTQQILPDLLDRLTLIRSATTPGPHPAAESLERALRQPLGADMPFEAAHLAQIRKGMPLAMAQPQSPWVSELKRILTVLIAE